MRQIRIGPRHPQPPTPLAAGREQSRGGEANASARSPLCHALPPVSVSGRVWGCLVRTPMTKKGTRPTRAQTRPRRELVSERGSGTPGSATQPSVKSGIRHGGLGSCRMGTCVAPDSAARPYKLGRPRSAACVRRHVAGERGVRKTGPREPRARRQWNGAGCATHTLPRRASRRGRQRGRGVERSG